MQGREAFGPGAHDWTERAAWLRRYTLALTRSRHDAEDLAQETIARVLERAPEKIDHEGYLLQTASRLWIDRQRSHARRGKLLRLWSPQPNVPRDHHDEQLSRVESVVAGLPPVQRAVLVLRTVMELDAGAIAAALEMEPKAVRSSLHLARKSVRERMGEQS